LLSATGADFVVEISKCSLRTGEIGRVLKRFGVGF
jgi:hypothetical protein